MDVFSIVCTKHTCMIEGDNQMEPYCPKGADAHNEICSLEDWNIFQTHNALMLMKDAVRTAVHNMQGEINRLNNSMKENPHC